MAQHTVDLPCIGDTYIDSDYPDTNYGSNTILKMCHYFVDFFLSRGIFLIFDHSSLPLRKKIISVKLMLYITEADPLSIGTGGLEIIHFSGKPWDEDTLTRSIWLGFGGGLLISRTKIGPKTLVENAYNSFLLPIGTAYNQGTGFSLDFTSSQTEEKDMSCHSRENTNKPMLRVVYEDVPPDKPTLVSPVGAYKDSASVVRFEWQYNSSVGGKQKKFDFQWSTNQSSWTTISETTENTYLDIPEDTFPVGNIYWRVQTYNEYDESSGYSDAAVFYSIGAPTAPIIQAVSNECRPLIEWSAFDQQIYQIQILQGEAVIYDSGDMPGISTRQYRIPIFLDDGEYSARVRIKNEYDMWSEWGTTSFSISTIKPDKPTLSIQRSRYGLELIIGGAQEVSYIYRDDICIARVTGEKYFDNAVANGKEYQYFVRALSQAGFADSDIELGTPSFSYGLLNAGDEIIELKHNLNSEPGKTMINNLPMTMNMYDGRKYPVPEISSNVNRSLSLTYFFRTYAEAEKLIEEANKKEVVLYRDKKGLKMYGVITNVTVQDVLQGYSVTFTVTATDFDEAVEI